MKITLCNMMPVPASTISVSLYEHCPCWFIGPSSLPDCAFFLPPFYEVISEGSYLWRHLIWSWLFQGLSTELLFLFPSTVEGNFADDDWRRHGLWIGQNIFRLDRAHFTTIFFSSFFLPSFLCSLLFILFIFCSFFLHWCYWVLP